MQQDIVKWSLFLLVLVAAVSSAPTDAGDGKCLKDASLGDRFEFNVYYCNDAAKPECCEVDSEFTCCETSTTHVAKEQGILWGSLGGVIGLMAIICVCYHKDARCCDRGCKCCSRKTDDKEPIVDDAYFDANFSGMKSPIPDIHTAPPVDDDSGRGSAMSSTSQSSHSDSRLSVRPTSRSVSRISVGSAASSRSRSNSPDDRPGSSRSRSNSPIDRLGSSRSRSASADRPGSARSSGLSETPQPDKLADIQL